MLFARSIAGTQLVLTCLTFSFAQPQPASPILALNVPLQIRLDANHPVSCQVLANAGEYVRVVVQPAGIPLKLRLRSPSGSEVMTFLNESGDQKLLPVSYIATDTGAVTLEFSPNDRDLPSQTFTVRLADRRPPSLRTRSGLKPRALFKPASFCRSAVKSKTWSRLLPGSKLPFHCGAPSATRVKKVTRWTP